MVHALIASGKSNLVKSWYCFGSMILSTKRKRGDIIEKFDPFILDKKYQKPIKESDKKLTMKYWKTDIQFGCDQQHSSPQ